MRVSENFDLSEFQCKCGCGKMPNPKDFQFKHLVASLEKYRETFSPGGLVIVSGFRCLKHHLAIYHDLGKPAPKDSAHLHGRGADVKPIVKLNTLKAKGWFSGLGYQLGNGCVSHVDTHHLQSVKAPAIWPYGG